MDTENLGKIVERELRTSPNLLYASRFQPDFLSAGFMASNEFDWHNSPLDTRKAGIFVGFGNNSVWDYAVRRNATHMVIGDWNAHVIIDQEYFFKPLLLAADTPADFLSMLSAVPLPPEIMEGSLDEIFDYIDRQLNAHSEEGSVNQGRRELVDITIERVEALSLGDHHADYVKKKLERTISPFMGTEDERYTDFSTYDPKNPIHYFIDRYQPKRLLKKGEGEADVYDSMFSFLSSRESFDHLKRLFDGNTYYVIGSFDSPSVYKSIATLARKLQAKISGLSFNNIVDFSAKDESRKADILGRACYFATSLLPLDERLTVYITKGQKPPHEYGQFNIGSPVEVAKKLSANGYDCSGINSESDFDRALRTIATNEPRITTANKYGVRIFFGDLHFSLLDGDIDFGSHVIDPVKKKPQDELLITTMDERMATYFRIVEVLEKNSISNPGVREYLNAVIPNGIPSTVTTDFSNPT